MGMVTDNEQMMAKQKQRLTLKQKAAVALYEYCLRQEDRYLGSVFVNPVGQRQVEARTREAYEAARRLGVSHLC